MKPSISVEQAIAIGIAHHKAGRIAEAEGVYRQVLARSPNHAGALDLLGVALLQTGRAEAALVLLRRAVAANPAKANYQCNLGECLRRLGRREEAANAFREAIRLEPDHPIAHNNLGIALSDSGSLDEAIASYNKAIQVNPDYAETYSNLANALKDLGRNEEALAAGAIAVKMRPDLAVGQNTLGVVLAAAGRESEAVAAYTLAIRLNPRYAEAYSNLGNALAAMGKPAEAVAVSRRAAELEPATVQFHWNYAVALLRSGDLALGFSEYEWRWVTQSHWPKPKPRYQPKRFPSPHWRGEELAGKTILLHSEQGFGDTIQFCRYVALVAARGGRVVLEVQPELARLCQGLAGAAQVIERGEPLANFDYQCPLMSLSLAFGTMIETIPSSVPYLSIAPEPLRQWKTAVEKAAARLRVGLCWAGSPTHTEDRARSLLLSQLAPLAAADATFYSLQKGPAADQAGAGSMRVVDLTADMNDFADTAAVIANLELVITVDTAVAHLAGALGKPVWVMLAALPDWRWLTGRADSPWYPTMRLFRQTVAGDWSGVIASVARELLRFQ